MAQKCERLPWEGSPALGAGCTSHGSQWCQIPHCAIQCPWCAGSNVSVCLLGTTLFLRMPCPGALKSPLSLCLGRSSSWHLLGESCFSLKSFFNYVRCVCGGRVHAGALDHMCGAQRTGHGGWFSPSTMCVLGGSGGQTWGKSLYPLHHLASPFFSAVHP